MRWTGAVERGAWLQGRGFGGTRDQVVPGARFAATVRILHPATRTWWEGPVNRHGSVRLREEPIAWAEVAALRGRVAHPWMQWGGISGSDTDEVDLGDGTAVAGPEDGRIPCPVLDALLPLLTGATSTPADVVAGIWEGWGELHHVVRFRISTEGGGGQREIGAAELGVAPEVTRALDRGPLLDLPGRRYVLLAGALADLADPDWTRAGGLGVGMGGEGVAAPQLLWPDDRAWCLATEIDFGFTLVAGSRALADAVLAAPGLEAVELDRDGDLSWNGDRLNPRPDARRG